MPCCVDIFARRLTQQELQVPACPWCAVPTRSFSSLCCALPIYVLCVTNSGHSRAWSVVTSYLSFTAFGRCHIRHAKLRVNLGVQTPLREISFIFSFLSANSMTLSNCQGFSSPLARQVRLYRLLCYAMPLPLWCLPLGQAVRGQREQKSQGFSLQNTGSMVRDIVPSFTVQAPIQPLSLLLELHESQERMEKDYSKAKSKQKIRTL